MATRKVLLLTYHFPPSGAVAAYRMLGLARHLPQFGWQPVVVTPTQVPWEPTDSTLLAQVPRGTPIERVSWTGGFTDPLARRIAPESHWIAKAIPVCGRMIAKHMPAAVITSSPPGVIHVLGRWVQIRHGLPWIACFRDPWVTNGLNDASLRQRIDRHLERMVMTHANQLVANTPRNLEGWRRVYEKHAHKMTMIPNGFDPERFKRLIDANQPGERLTLLHTGELYAGRDPRPFLDAMQQLHAEKLPIAAEFLGRNTEQSFDLSNEIRRRGLEGVVNQLGQVPYEASLDKMMRADILLLFQTPGNQIGIPAKLYEYFGAGRPVLAVSELDSDIAWALRESKILHRIAAPTDVAGIREGLRELLSELRARRTAAPYSDTVLQFTREKMAERFAACLDNIAPQ
jgi:glycosyltransferase involved in cell wall biosynthesis